ncbi:hypothetical protein CITSP_03539 [Citrobacter sp. T1.2D-1]|nr:hypothetical protein CITSP_03539 [Citrobacter sp. T1.2D-1]
MIILTPRIDIGGERWFTPLKDLKPIEGLKLLVSSIDNDQYRSRNALIRRHIERWMPVTRWEPANLTCQWSGKLTLPMTC